MNLRCRVVMFLSVALVGASAALASAAPADPDRGLERAIERAGGPAGELVEAVADPALDRLAPGVNAQVTTATSATPVPSTLYLHALLPLGNAEQTAAFALDVAGVPGPAGPPSMSSEAPASVTPKVSAGASANPAFRGNPLTAFWGTPLSAAITGPSHATFWASGTGTITVELFGDGGFGVATPIGAAEVTIASPLPTRYDVDIPGNAVVESSAVFELAPSDGVLAFFDSIDMPSSVTLNLSAPTASLTITDPTGIALRGPGTPVVGSTGTGQVLAIDANGSPTAVVAGNLVVSHFTRGVQGVAVDDAGDVFYALAEEGEVRFVRPDGTGGTYARGLGAVGGIAFAPDGMLYAVDQEAGRVLQIAPDGTVSSTWTDGSDPCPAGPCAAQLLAHPYGIAISPAGAIYVSDPFGWVVRIHNATAAGEVIGSDLESPEGLALADDGATLLVGEGHGNKVTAVDIASGTKRVINAGKSGLVNLAADTTTLWVAAQCENGGCSDGVFPIAFPAGMTGTPANRPAVTPTALADLGSDVVAHRAPRIPTGQLGSIGVDPASVAELPVAAAHRVGRGASEPTIGVTPNGHVFYMAASIEDSVIKPAEKVVTGFPRPLVMRSADSGSSWTDVTPRVAGVDVTKTTADPYLYVDPATGRIFDDQLTLACSYLAFSDDEGATWTHNPAACGLPNDDHQTIAAGPAPAGAPTPVGYPNVVYYCVNQVAAATCARSLDGGQTFTHAGIAKPGVDPAFVDVDPEAATVSGRCGGLTGHAWVGNDGTLYLPYSQCGRPQLAMSSDEGVTWTRVDVSRLVLADQHEAVVRTDPAGNIYFMWIGRDRLPYLATSRDHGATWSIPLMIAPPAVTETNLPTMAVGAQGSVVFGYQGTASTCCYRDRDYGRAAWNGYMTMTTNALAADPLFLTVTANDRHDPLLRGACGPDRCAAPYNWDFDDAVIAPDGRPWVAFIDSCTALCATKETGNDDYQGVAATFSSGPRLR